MEKTATGVSSMVSGVSLIDTLLQPLLAAKYGYWDFGAVAFENPFREGPVAVPDGTPAYNQDFERVGTYQGGEFEEDLLY